MISVKPELINPALYTKVHKNLIIHATHYQGPIVNNIPYDSAQRSLFFISSTYDTQ